MSYSSPETVSSGDELTVDYEHWKGTLRRCLDGIKSVGDIATFKRYTSFTNPGLKIEGYDAFPLPLTPENAELVKGACRQAPFGKGNDTLVDTSVRNTWELEHNQFELLNPEWPVFLVKVGVESAGDLGLVNISLMPHKLLLYEKGSFFKRHKDTEKEPGMVGTLVICLPSEHTGGDVHVSFGSEERSYSTAPTSKFDLTALAWYPDVSHEVKELEAGYRLALRYNIVQNGSKNQSAGFFGQQAQQIKKFLLEWQWMFPDKEKLIHRLDHKYFKVSLAMPNLKGRDSTVCRALHEVASDCGAYLLFGHLTRSEEGGPDDIGDGDTYNNLTALYSFDGKPVSRGDMTPDEEILNLNKLSEGIPDSKDEGEFTGNERAESTLRYHHTVAVLVKKKSLHRYVSPVTNCNPTRDLYTENMVRMVADDMVRVMKDQTVNEHARPPLLEVIRKALGSRGSSKSITPLAVYWALNLEDSALYQSAMASAAKSGIYGIRDSAIKIAASFIEQRFGDRSESIDWGKWVGSAAELDTVAGVQNTINNFTPVFEKDAVRDSFVEWGEAKLRDKFKNQASFDIAEHLFFVKAIGEKHGDKDWLMSILVPALASRGTRGLIYGVLRFVFVKKAQAEFAIVKELFEYVLHHAIAKLLLQGADLLPKPAGSGLSNIRPPTREPPNHVPPPSSEPLGDFIAIVDHSITLGLTEKGRELLEACCNQLVRTKEEWDPKKVDGEITLHFLSPIIDILEEHSIPPTQGVKDLFEVILREGLHASVPRSPPEHRGWALKPYVCSRNYGGLGVKCKECEALNAFLVAPDQKSWRYQAGKPTRGTHTLVVEKTEREFADAVVSWQQSVWALRVRLAPLQDELVAKMLGDEAYRELVLAGDLWAQLEASEGLVPSGMKRALDAATTEVLFGGKKVRL